MFRKKLFFLLVFSVGVSAQSTISTSLLPNPFPVYTNGIVVINHPSPGFQQKNLPTNNDYARDPGCYVVCYSHEGQNAIYAVSKTIYVHGQIRVPGSYFNRICVPQNYEGKNISATPEFSTLCNNKIKSCKDCWAGGDSGGWFGSSR